MIRWPHRTSRCTIVLKVAFGGAGAQSTLLPDPATVTIDRFDSGGILSAPSDFAPFKPRCDVVLVGRGASGATAARLVVRTDGTQPTQRPAVDKAAKHARLLAARPTLGELSDPTDPGAQKLWSDAAFDFARFQCAPLDQRVDFPRRWLAFTTELEGSKFELTIPLGVRVFALQGGAERAVPVQADTFLVDPVGRRCGVSYRGVIDSSDIPVAETTLIISTQPANLPALMRGADGTFRAGAAIEPGALRRLAAESPEPEARRLIRTPARTERMPTRTEKLGRAAPPAPPSPPPQAQEVIMLSTQDLLIVELGSDEELSATRETEAARRPPPLPLPVQDTVTLARDDIPPLNLLEDSFDNELTIDEDAARHMDPLASAPSVTQALDEDSWNESTLDRTPPLPSRGDRRADADQALERSDTLTITGEAAVPQAAALPFRKGGDELEAAHTLTISGEEANEVALPFERPPKTVPPPPTPPPPARQAAVAAQGGVMRLALRPPPASSVVEPPAMAADHGVKPSPKGIALSLDQLMTIKRELFDAPDQRRAILAQHGLTGLEWRLAERSLARDLDDKSMNAERLRKLLGRP